jgi:hydrogenase expression/formation protein HypC
MCLAVPGKVIEHADDEAIIDLQGNRIKISTLLTPGVGVGDWVLAHAGYAISRIEEKDALETWDWLRAMSGDSPPTMEGPPLPPHRSDPSQA